MAQKVLAFIALITFAAIAYGQPCNAGVCKVDVTVAAAGCADPTNITVSVDPLPVHGPNNIEWTIKTPNYTWVPEPNGITSLPSSQFTNPHVTGNGLKYDLHDANTGPVPTDYKYDIHLQSNGTLCAVKDPIIRNN
jgi:hypothetical protein